MTGKYFLLWAVHFASIILFVKIIGGVLPLFSICHYQNIMDLVLGVIVAAETFHFTKKFYLSETISSRNKAVLITGCDSGFGNFLAKRLHSKGFQVFACCLFPEGDGATELQENCPVNLQIVPLDVTKDESVKQAAEIIKKNLGKNELWAIVNNAGITAGFSIEMSTLGDFQRCMDVNVFGGIRVAKAFLPLIKKCKGRVVNITSAAGRFNIPYFAPYCMSKFAAVSFSETLRREMDVWGVRVISIEPDFFKTKLFDHKDMDDRFEFSFSSLDEDRKAEYGEEFVGSMKQSKDILLKLNSSNFHKVVDALDSAITLKHPDLVYKPRGSIFSRLVLFIFLSGNEYLQDLCVKMAFIVVRFPKPKAAKKT